MRYRVRAGVAARLAQGSFGNAGGLDDPAPEALRDVAFGAMPDLVSADRTDAAEWLTSGLRGFAESVWSLVPSGHFCEVAP